MDEIIYETDRGHAVITINRPDKRNALDKASRDGLFSAIREANDDQAVRVLIITGAGDKAFCAGADLTEMASNAMGAPGKNFTPRLRQNIDIDKPVIAAVNGFALAGGFLLAQMCDLAVAASTATFGITEAKWGRGAPWAMPLASMLPQRIMLELLLTAEPLRAQRMYELGFINKIVEPGEVLAAAKNLAETIAGNAPLTVAAHLRATLIGAEMGVSAAERVADALFEPVYASEDALEGPAAFREHRLPKWKGR